MPMSEKGARVGAIRNEQDNTVYFFGFGTFEGREVPPNGALVFGFRMKGQSNPKIKLDNGNIVWGYQCWWGPEEVIKRRLEGKKVVNVNPPTEEEEAQIEREAQQEGET